MRLVVLGATGGIGRHIVDLGVQDGHQVTAVVRDPARLPMEHPELSVVRGSALDAGFLGTVVHGADAVLSGVGAAGRKDPLKPASTCARAAVEAMTVQGVRRILVVSAGTLNRTGAGQSFLAGRVAGPLLWKVLRDAYTDLETMEDVLRGSGLDWTSVRPPRLTDKPGRGRYRRTIETGPAGNTVPRADVARAMLDLVDDSETIGHSVGVSG